MLYECRFGMQRIEFEDTAQPWQGPYLMNSSNSTAQEQVVSQSVRLELPESQERQHLIQHLQTVTR